MTCINKINKNIINKHCKQITQNEDMEGISLCSVHFFFFTYQKRRLLIGAKGSQTKHFHFQYTQMTLIFPADAFTELARGTRVLSIRLPKRLAICPPRPHLYAYASFEKAILASRNKCHSPLCLLNELLFGRHGRSRKIGRGKHYVVWQYD